MLLSKQKKTQNAKGGNRLLITINVLGSAGPMRFVVSELELVVTVMEMTLKSYAREGRLPVLGSDLNDFLLYCPNAGSDALSPWETIGAHGARNFLLCKKPQPQKASEVEPQGGGITRKGSGSWKTWINKTLSLKIASH